MGLLTIALADLARLTTPTVPYRSFVLPFVLAGVGMSLFFAPTANAVLASVGISDEGKASGVLNTIRQFGAVLGVAAGLAPELVREVAKTSVTRRSTRPRSPRPGFDVARRSTRS